ncbi:hypothetical protein [Bacteroidetes bacterium endosymbiont of Geopemphigus sp.]|uniref:hypothetical protein n=1 Tax=Bacteroidetes bacterium endosymbiont of Geopemphigus sp. TaxID=2047937 RepID=UPI000CD30025|nr:hypothetical protein [Bacteroidetes bacterium endosymbiont of Geopemphigus sp.]
MENPKHAANYPYYKSIYHLKKSTIKKMVFSYLKKIKLLFSLLSVVFYEYYDHPKEIERHLEN